MGRLKEDSDVVVADQEVVEEKSKIICGIDVSKLIPYTTEDELPQPVYRTKMVKGKKIEQLVEKGEPRYYTQANGQEMVQVRRGFHRVERKWFCRIHVKDPQWKPFIEEIRRRGIREVF